MKYTVSVIIPTYNEEKVIGECLASLFKQTCKNMEVIVVDDGSTDGTVSKIKNRRSELQIKNLKVLRQGHRGPGPARNLGAKHARGKILVFVDADMTFATDFLHKLVQPVEEGKAKGTFSKEEYVANPENIWSRCWGINEGWKEGMRHPKSYPNKQKVFRAMLKSEFDRVGGFSRTGEYTDDWSLSEKLGYEATAAHGAVFYHKNPESLSEVFFQAKWIGKRPYKLGIFGQLVALVRAFLLVSVVIGATKGIFYKSPLFPIFKVVYDFGIFVGVISSVLGGSSAK